MEAFKNHGKLQIHMLSTNWSYLCRKGRRENDRLLIFSDVGCVQIGTDFETSSKGQASDDAAIRSQTVENAGKFISPLVHLLIKSSPESDNIY